MPPLSAPVPDHPPTHRDALLRLLEAGTGVRRRFQFDIWLQHHWQAVLPHQIVVCGTDQPGRSALAFEAFNSAALAPAALALLTDVRSPLLAAATQAWVGASGEPVVLPLAGLAAATPGSVAGPAVAAGLRALHDDGFHLALVHGVPRPQRPDAPAALFLLVQRGRSVDSTRMAVLAMLLPWLHSAFRRVQAADPEPADPDAAAGAAAYFARWTPLTSREQQVLDGLHQGRSNQQIGAALGIHPLTVKAHVQKVLRKLGAADRAQAVAQASAIGLPPSDATQAARRP